MSTDHPSALTRALTAIRLIQTESYMLRRFKSYPSAERGEWFNVESWEFFWSRRFIRREFMEFDEQKDNLRIRLSASGLSAMMALR